MEEIKRQRGKSLIKKRSKSRAAHNIDLMLEDFEKKIPLHKDTIARDKKMTTYTYCRTSLVSLLDEFTNNVDLIRPKMTHFTTTI